MKHSLRHIRLCIPAIIMSGVMASCSTDDDYNDRIFYSSIVTIQSTDKASGTVFTFQRYDDSPLITLTAAGRTVDKGRVGSRALLYYYPESATRMHRALLRYARSGLSIAIRR